MKKFLIVFIFLFLLSFFSAASINMNEEFDSGETLIANIKGNFVTPITDSNVFFYRGHVRIPLTYDVQKINNEYYVYAQLLDKEENNYSISIEDVTYFVGSGTSTEDIVKTFTITNLTADFSVNPGFLYTSKDFSLELRNLQESEITVDNSEGESLDLLSGEIKDLDFDISNMANETGLVFIELSTENLIYSIPIYIVSSSGDSSIIGDEEDVIGDEEEINGDGDFFDDVLEEDEEDEVVVELTTEEKEELERTCANLNGTVCGSGEECTVDQEPLPKGFCCIGGTCEKVKKSSLGRSIGWTIVVFVILFLIYFYRKSKGRGRRKINLLKRRK